MQGLEHKKMACDQEKISQCQTAPMTSIFLADNLNFSDQTTSFINSLRESGSFQASRDTLVYCLDSISKELKHQTTLLTKLSYLENEQSIIKRDLNEVALKQSSVKIWDNIEQCKKKSIGTSNSPINETNDEDNKSAAYSDQARTNTPSSLTSTGKIKNIEKQRLEYLHDAYSIGNEHNTGNKETFFADQIMRREIFGLKVLVHQLQKDQDKELSTSLEYDRKLNKTSIDIMNLHKVVNYCVSSKEFINLQKQLERQRIEMENYIKDFLIQTQDKLSTKSNSFFSKFETWLKENDGLMNQHQSNLKDILSSCAKSRDLNALRADIDMESKDIRHCVEKIDFGVQKNKKLLSSIKEFMALTTFRKNYTIMTRRMLLRGWTKWQQFNREQKETKITTIKRVRLMKKAIKHQLGGLKRMGFIAWKSFIRHERICDEKKRMASELIFRILKHLSSQPLENAFKRWHRIVIMDKVDLFELGESYIKDENDDDVEKTFNIVEAIKCFDKDFQGGLSFLARELHKVKRRDIGQLRQDWDLECKSGAQRFENWAVNVQSKIDSKLSTFETRVTTSMDFLRNEISTLKSDMSSVQCGFMDISDRVRRIEEIHRRRIDILHEHKEKSEEEIHNIKCELHRTNEEILSLVEQQQASLKKIEEIHEEMVAAKENNKHLEQHLNQARNEFLQKFKITKGEIKKNVERCDNVDTMLNSTNETLQIFKRSACSDITEIKYNIYTPGILKPKLDIMVKNCITYEKKASEKNFVVAINSVYDKEENIDISEYMAAFAHDYGAWIAYEADREAVLRIIAGGNPEEISYVDDGIESRRKSLLER